MKKAKKHYVKANVHYELVPADWREHAKEIIEELACDSIAIDEAEAIIEVCANTDDWEKTGKIEIKDGVSDETIIAAKRVLERKCEDLTWGYERLVEVIYTTRDEQNLKPMLMPNEADNLKWLYENIYTKEEMQELPAADHIEMVNTMGMLHSFKVECNHRLALMKARDELTKEIETQTSDAPEDADPTDSKKQTTVSRAVALYMLIEKMQGAGIIPRNNIDGTNIGRFIATIIGEDAPKGIRYTTAYRKVIGTRGKVSKKSTAEAKEYLKFLKIED